MIVKSVKMI